MCWGFGNIISLASHSDPVIILFLTFTIQPLYSFSYLLLRKPRFNEVKLSNYSSYSSIITEKGGASWTWASGSQSLKHLLSVPVVDGLPRLQEPDTPFRTGLVARIPPRDSLPGMGLNLGRRGALHFWEKARHSDPLYFVSLWGCFALLSLTAFYTSPSDHILIFPFKVSEKASFGDTLEGSPPPTSPLQLALISPCPIFLPDRVPRGGRGVLRWGCPVGRQRRRHLGTLREGIFQAFKLNLSILLTLDHFFLWGQRGGNVLDYSSPLAFWDQDLYCLIISHVVIIIFFSFTDTTNFPWLRLGLFLFGHFRPFQWSFCALSSASDVSFTQSGFISCLTGFSPALTFREYPA